MMLYQRGCFSQIGCHPVVARCVNPRGEASNVETGTVMASRAEFVLTGRCQRKGRTAVVLAGSAGAKPRCRLP